MDLGQRAASVKFLIRDRAGQFSSSFDAVLTAEGIRILVNEHHLHKVLAEYLRHYNTARPHRSPGQLTPAQAGTCPPERVNLAEHRIQRKQVLGGLTHEYYVAA
jgi:putative transposase